MSSKDLTSATVVADSVGPNLIRLVTLECTYPLIVHNELMTHRAFSRNTASNRAIPVERMIEGVMLTPFVPKQWPKNQKGMQAQTFLEGVWAENSEKAWLRARDEAVKMVRELQELGVHKQITNRLLAPWLYTTALVTATEWANFFSLRCHKDAQPEMQELAYVMRAAMNASIPKGLASGEWHTPYVRDGVVQGPFISESKDLTGMVEGMAHGEVRWACMVSVGRCAGVSYLRQGEQKDGADAYDLAVRLRASRHWSPFEHVAQAQRRITKSWSGNLRGWKQLRKFFLDENTTTYDGIKTYN